VLSEVDFDVDGVVFEVTNDELENCVDIQNLQINIVQNNFFEPQSHLHLAHAQYPCRLAILNAFY
jgi:stress response protein SCP2